MPLPGLQNKGCGALWNLVARSAENRTLVPAVDRPTHSLGPVLTSAMVLPGLLGAGHSSGDMGYEKPPRAP
eukprot:2111147-Rhodomonas_salina.2